MADEIPYENRGRVAVSTINRPEARNALTRGVRAGLRAAWERVAKDGAARVAIRPGAGDQAFCAGADLKEMTQTKRGSLPRNVLPTLNVNRHGTKPVVAAARWWTWQPPWAGGPGWRRRGICSLMSTALKPLRKGRGRSPRSLSPTGGGADDREVARAEPRPRVTCGERNSTTQGDTTP